MPKYTLEVGGKTYDIESDRSLSDGELAKYASQITSAPATTGVGTGVSTAIPFIPEQTRQEMAEAERNVRGGVLRGLGSVAATVGLPQAARAMGVESVPTRETMDAYLARTMGVDPESITYKGGQIGAEIGVGLPVPKAIGALAARVPGLAAYAPAISSAGFNPGALTGPQNLMARIGGGAIGGGAAAGIVNPQDAAVGAMLGSVLSPGAQVVLGAGRMVRDRFIDPAIGAANALVKAGGEGLANALQATRGMKTTPGFTPTLAERAVEGGIESPALAAMERRLSSLPAEQQKVYEANKARVVALRDELASIDAEIAKQGAAITPEATAELNTVRTSLQQRLAAEQSQLTSLAEQLTGGLAKTGQKLPGEQLAERARELQTEVRKGVVTPAYNAAFKAAGDTPIDVSNVIANAESILGKPLTAWEPSTAPPIVRELLKLKPKAPAAQIGRAHV